MKLIRWTDPCSLLALSRPVLLERLLADRITFPCLRGVDPDRLGVLLIFSLRSHEDVKVHVLHLHEEF